MPVNGLLGVVGGAVLRRELQLLKKKMFQLLFHCKKNKKIKNKKQFRRSCLVPMWTHTPNIYGVGVEVNVNLLQEASGLNSA